MFLDCKLCLVGKLALKSMSLFSYSPYVTELTQDKKVNPDTFARMAGYYSQRAICEIVWLVASEHFYNMTNIGLNIHSDRLCDISRQKLSLDRT
jgi:hypothetical protein